MAPKKPSDINVETFSDHLVITQPNPLRAMVHYVEEKDFDDPVARAEQALADLSGEFKEWMRIECDRLHAAHAAIKRDGVNKERQDEMFRAAHDVKGHAATFGYPTAAAAAESLTRIIEHAPDLAKVPEEIITHHINAILAIFREQKRRDESKAETADELSKRLRSVADEYLIAVNQDRPEHLEAVLAPSIAPTE
ncbi:Hpt domain-containing protein [Bradyrhizobium sp. SYSU BS000235]|uniref:Hpt domain-containing protein n=1 Tax=Bradyrhizobium sp. SYSU BS000235 TaxID=3411332 RepID=UPI003C7767EF